MSKSAETREKLLTQARSLTWARGYSNVSLRAIATEAGVDVALISRYFGGKRGLFEATLADAFDFPDMPALTRDNLVEVVIHQMTQSPRDHDVPSFFQLILNNAHDAEVGEMVQKAHATQMQALVEDALQNKAQAALFMSVVMGLIMSEKTLHLDGIAPHESDAYQAQLRHMLNAALSFQG